MDGKQHNPLIILIEFMGAGKTTIGKLLARQLGFDFYDTDQEVERLSGASVSWIFEGEIGFRARESRVLDRLTRMNQVVLATGGGAVATLENHAYLKRGIIIYLRAEVDIQYERTCRDKNRPLLQTENPKQKLQALLKSVTLSTNNWQILLWSQGIFHQKWFKIFWQNCKKLMILMICPH